MPNPYRRYLVTGGAGFIGHRVVANLLMDDECEVAVVDNLSAGLPMPPPTPRLATRNADIRDAPLIDEVFSSLSPDVVIHLAAIHHIPTCETRRAYALHVNVVGAENVLEAASRAKVARFVLASSGAVYDWRDGPLDESTTPLRPADNYSVAKHTNETQARLWADRTGGQAAIARIFNTIGQNDPNAHLVPDIIAQIPVGAAAVEISLGNLSPRRDYIHVEDTARAIVAIAQARLPTAVEVFNVATGRDVSVAELVDLLGRTMGVRISVREDPTRKRRVDRPSQLGATEKITRMLDFRPQRNLRDALLDIVQQSGWRCEAAR